MRRTKRNVDGDGNSLKDASAAHASAKTITVISLARHLRLTAVFRIGYELYTHTWIKNDILQHITLH